MIVLSQKSQSIPKVDFTRDNFNLPSPIVVNNLNVHTRIKRLNTNKNVWIKYDTMKDKRMPLMHNNTTKVMT